VFVSVIRDPIAKRLLHREAREDRHTCSGGRCQGENTKPQTIIQDNLRDGLTFSKRP
jgi:hypothetical protein